MSARINGIDPDKVVVDAAGQLVLADDVECVEPGCTKTSKVGIGWRIDSEPWPWKCPVHLRDR